MILSDYELSNQYTLKYLQKKKSNTVVDHIKYLTLNLGYTSMRQRTLLDQLGISITLPEVKKLVKECIDLYYKQLNRPIHKY